MSLAHAVQVICPRFGQMQARHPKLCIGRRAAVWQICAGMLGIGKKIILKGMPSFRARESRIVMNRFVG